MSQHDFDSADGSGAAVRADFNAAIQAVASNNSGNSSPPTTYAYMFWADTTTGLLKQRNAANSAWLTLGTLADLGLQSSAQIVAAAGGSADAITATYAPVPPALVNGLTLLVRAGSANATTTPTFSPNGLTAKTIVKGAGSAVNAGDIAGAGHWLELQYDSTLDKWVLQNPATGILGVKQLQPITASVAANALTVQLSATSLDFRSATLGSGTVNTRAVGSTISVVVPSGATMGTSNAVANRMAVLAIDNAGTVELAVVNAAGGLNLDETGLISTTTISTGADLSTVIYSTTARTSVPYRVVGFVESTQATAGTWATSPSTIQGAGGLAMAVISGQIVQTQTTATGASATGTTIIPQDDTIPQITEGDEYMTCVITPTRAGSILEIDVNIMVTNSVLTWMTAALFRDATANALAAAQVYGVTTTTGGFLTFRHRVAAGSTSATTFRVRAGGSVAGTTTFNGIGGTRSLGGVMASSITVREIMA